jgi:hypothetical protein
MEKIGIISFSVAILAFFIIFIGYKYLIKRPKLDAVDLKRISITALPSPPKIKNITKEEDIKKFVTFFNSIQLSPSIHQGSKGWKYKIQINASESHLIYLVGNNLEFDGVWYSTKRNVIKKMDYLYNIFNYPEQSLK